MTSNSCIFVFTRDRPDKLKIALHSIRNVNYPIFIVDDSVHNRNRISNKNNIKKSVHFYIGKYEFLNLVSQYNIDTTKFSFLLRQLGDDEWNLGCARNLALIYANTKGFDNVLFMDEDIEVPFIQLIDDLFSLLTENNFVGAHIGGLLDDSILGHIATGLHVFNERMLSGGFMAFKLSSVEHYFLNYYNEDWIWLFLQLPGKRFIQTGEVFQEIADPLEDYRSKVLFQEFGEILLDGILDCYPQKEYGPLCSLMFWERMTEERDEYLKILIRKAKMRDNIFHVEILQYVINNSGGFKPVVFKVLFTEYFSNLCSFQVLFDSLKK